MVQKDNNLFLYFSVFSANLLAFSAGSAFSWTSPVIPKLTSNDSTINPLPAPITTFEESWITSSMIVGAILGSVVSGLAAKRIGRKMTMVVFSIPIFISFIMFAFGKCVSVFLIARFITGIGAGCAFSILPSFIGEISKDNIRGFTVNMFGVMVVTGQLLNYIVGPIVSIKMLNLIHLAPLCLFYVTFIKFVPDSPYYFIAQNDFEEAELSLKKFRSSTKVEKELLYMKDCIQDAEDNKLTLKDLFKSRSLIRGLTITCGVFILQQFSGINAILGYLQTIFDASGSSISAYYSVVIVGVIQVLSNILSSLLADKLGRKPLLIVSAFGASTALMSLGTYFFLQNRNFNVQVISWLPVTSLIVFVITFNLGFASVPWTIAGELFASNVKSIATSFSTCICLMTSFIVILCFPYMTISLGMAGTFWLFSVGAALAAIFTAIVVPETKGKSLSEIQAVLIK